MNIIGVNGFKRSGKGEVGNAIGRLSLGVRQLGFADKLKIFAARSLGYTDPKMTDAERIALMDEAKEAWVLDISKTGSYMHGGVGRGALPGRQLPDTPIKRWTGRQLLQYMGTEARIVFGEDFWVNQVLPRPHDFWVDQVLPRPHYFDHDDLLFRYPGVTTLVFTDQRFENEAQRIIDLGGFNVRVHRPGVESDGHASELVLPDRLFQYEIRNDGTLLDLEWKVNQILELEGLMP